ncbi:UDP-2,3-diacylglucosamine diphosphatase [Thermophagus xiamenensis]|jgi:UDP-2,3-diacylglucosamine pyrophosphatase LpxH|uniref:UDP-2,3-diacylglucosamine pyrophosphatase LpxH n=1 Tax=Thermophagus xiamenensis TaxID=385682 RepID=A0A1I1UTG7_9BACT|nr:UDP-2,3-diacylglucosamine diphosphatase [Thermophagus xiamenensis]SFD74112.1 UDP-2,3-diacylglucosamine pyrophosphatase LpxH [Thermophagus xiamenensis]
MQDTTSATKRKLKAVVLSDMHLGTYGCKAEHILNYLKTIKPETLVLNGDIIDGWQFSRTFFPSSHLKVVRQLIKMMENGTQIIYIPGNHDEVLRRFTSLNLGNFSIENKAVLSLDNKKTWIFHGDVFDVFMHHSKWLARLGAKGYGLLNLLNKAVNSLLSVFGKKPLSFSKKIKDKVKGSAKAITRFERTVAQLAIEKQYDFVICGHIHRPEDKIVKTEKGNIRYLNSGDWIENLSALEYENGDWHLKFWEPSYVITTEETSNDKNFNDPSKAIFYRAFKEVLSS